MSAAVQEQVTGILEGVAPGSPPCSSCWGIGLRIGRRRLLLWRSKVCGLPSVARMTVTCRACGHVDRAFLCSYHAAQVRAGRLVTCTRCSAKERGNWSES